MLPDSASDQCQTTWPDRSVACSDLCVKVYHEGRTLDTVDDICPPPACDATKRQYLMPSGDCATAEEACANHTAVATEIRKINGLNYCVAKDSQKILTSRYHTNPCACLDSPIWSHQVCPGGTNLTAKVNHWSHRIEVDPPSNATLHACTALLPHQSDFAVSTGREDTPLGHIGFAECPLAVVYEQLNYSTSISLLEFISIVALILNVCHGLRKYLHQKSHPAEPLVTSMDDSHRRSLPPGAETPSTAGATPLIAFDTRQNKYEALQHNRDLILQTGYRQSSLGSCALASIIMLACYQVIFLILQILDTYGVFGEAFCPEQTNECILSQTKPYFHWRQGWACSAHCLFSGDYIGKVAAYWPYFRSVHWGGRYYLLLFLADWFTTITLLIILKSVQSSLKCYYRLQCGLDEATDVQILRSARPAVLVEGKPSALQLWLQRSRRATFNLFNVRVNHIGSLRFFDFLSIRFVYAPESRAFTTWRPGTLPPLSGLVGLSELERRERIEQLGKNVISVPVPSFHQDLFNEFTRKYFLYQFFCLLVWFQFYYWFAASVVVACTILASFLRLLAQRAAKLKLKRMAELSEPLEILNETGVVVMTTTDNLTLGDVVVLHENMRVPADMTLVFGDILVNESSLTGETAAVPKFSDSPSQCTLHSGSMISCVTRGQVSGPGSCRAFGRVIAVGAYTLRGRIIQNSMDPISFHFKFEDHWDIIFFVLLAWAILNAVFGAYVIDWAVEGWYYGIFTVSQIISPLIPSVFVAGQALCARSLTSQGIDCANMQRAMVAGKVKKVCFDKTGTLTTSNLAFAFAQSLSSDETGLAYPTMLQDLDQRSLIAYALALCHDLYPANDRGDIAPGGDLDQALFRASTAVLRYPPPNSNIICSIVLGSETWDVIKRESFSRLTGMSGACTRLSTDESGALYSWMKGSWEVMRDTCVNLSPEEKTNIDEQVRQISQQGYYVIGMAFKQGVVADNDSELSDWMKSDLHFLGICALSSLPVPNAALSIQSLREGGTAVHMITGDNVYTAIRVARDIGILTTGLPVAIYSGLNGRDCVIAESQQPLPLEQAIRDAQEGQLELALLGSGLEQLIDPRTGVPINAEAENMILLSKIAARVTPEQKAQLVRSHMKHDVTAMVGDGANDAAAIEASHCGVAITGGARDLTAASFAHFAIWNHDALGIVEIMRYGRAALASTTAGYKFLVIYGEIMAMVSALEMLLKVCPAEAYYILVDVVINGCMLWAILSTKPSRKLSRHRPSSSLLGPSVFFSTLFQTLTNWVCMIFVVKALFRQDWIQCKEFFADDVDHSLWWTKSDNYEAATLGVMASYQWALIGPSINFGYKFRRAWIKNWKVHMVWITMVLLITSILSATGTNWSCLFHTNCGDATLLQHWHDTGYWNNIVASSPRNAFWSNSTWIPSGCPCTDQIDSTNNAACENEYASVCANSYYQLYHHNIFPVKWRLFLLAVVLANFIANVLIERVIIMGILRKVFSRN